MTLYKKFEEYMLKPYIHEMHVYDKHFKAPDWRKYKVDDVPELVNVRNALASQGLKDPWLRNEVWRYNPAFGSSSRSRNMVKVLTRGWKLGLGVALMCYSYNQVFHPERNSHSIFHVFDKDDHGGHH